MGLKTSGRIHENAAPYQVVYPAGIVAPVDLTEAVGNARCLTSGLLLIATATSVSMTWRDATGTLRDTGTLTAVVGQSFDLPIGAAELTTNVGLLVIAYWHPRGGAA